jgi:5-methyltetrahydropteroyltriglutamate--homocysteine methyltransferase
MIVLGLVRTKVTQLETVAELKGALTKRAGTCRWNRLRSAPRAGSLPMSSVNLLGEDNQKRKLEVVVETARQVWC